MTTKHSINNLLILFLVSFFFSCGSSENKENVTPQPEPQPSPQPQTEEAKTEKSENYEITYKFNENVQILDNKAQNYIVKVEQDSILYFNLDTPDEMMPKVGTILSSRISDKLPYGMGNKVVSRTDENGMAKIVTSVASLDDIFDVIELKSEFTTEDLVKNISKLVDEDGKSYEVSMRNVDDVFSDGQPALSRWQTRASAGSDKIIEIPVTVETESDLFSEVKLVIGAVVTFQKSKSKGSFEYSFEPSIGIVGEFGAKSEKQMGDTIKKLLTLLKKTRLFSTHLPIAGGLIDLRPYADLNVDLVGSVNGKISVGFSYYAKYKCGWNQGGFFNENTSTDRNLKSIFNSFELKGGAEIGPEATIATGCGLYTTDIALSIDTKPSIMIGAEIGASGDSDGVRVKVEDQKVTLDVSVDLQGTGKVKLFGKEILSGEVSLAKWNLYNKEWPIFSFFDPDKFSVDYRGNSSWTRSHSSVRGDGESPTFDARYSLTGGEMTKIMKGKPAIIVEENGKEIQRIVSDVDAFTSEQTDLCFELSGLKDNVRYTAVPCVVIGNNVYHWAGKEFSHSVETSDLCPDDNHPHVIDLGLPSGTKWACCNVGASAPEAFGDYYAWGETQTKRVYNADTYKYCNRDPFGWVNIGTDIAGSKYDVATVKWGASWRMPNQTQFEELFEKCKLEWAEQNGVYGAKCIGPNDNCVFLPAADYYRDDVFMSGVDYITGLPVYYGIYWTSTAIEDWSAYYVSFGRMGKGAGTGGGSEGRTYGRSIRPISKQ